MKIKKLTSILLASLACLSLGILIPSVYSCSSSQSSSNQQQESNNQFNIKTDSGMIGVIISDDGYSCVDVWAGAVDHSLKSTKIDWNNTKTLTLNCDTSTKGIMLMFANTFDNHNIYINTNQDCAHVDIGFFPTISTFNNQVYLNNKSIFKYLEVETITIMPYGVFLNNHNYKIQYGSIIQNINFPSEVYVKNCNIVTIDDFYDNHPESITIHYKGQKPTVENTQDIQIKFIDDN